MERLMLIPETGTGTTSGCASHLRMHAMHTRDVTTLSNVKQVVVAVPGANQAETFTCETFQ